MFRLLGLAWFQVSACWTRTSRTLQPKPLGPDPKPSKVVTSAVTKLLAKSEDPLPSALIVHVHRRVIAAVFVAALSPESR